MIQNQFNEAHKSLHILYSGLGGHASVVFALVKGDVNSLTKASAVFYGVEPMLDIYKERCDQDGVNWVEVKKQRLIDVTSGSKIYKAIEQQDPDAIVVHVPQALMSAVKWRDHKPATKIIVVEHHPNNLKRRIDWYYGKRSMKYADHVVFLTPSYKQEVQEKYGNTFDEEKSVIIPNGVDTDVYKPAERVSSNGAFCFGMCTRLSDQKDIATLIKAFAALSLENPTVQLELHIAGDGDLRESLEQLAVETKTQSGSVLFHGMLDEKALVGFFQQLDAYVHATQHETMSTSVMQALSTGLPCIASDVPGMFSLVPKSVGELTKIGDTQRLTSEMGVLLTNNNVRNDRSQAARTFALDHLSCEKAAESYFKLMN